MVSLIYPDRTHSSQYSGFFVNLHGWWIESGNVFIAMEYLRHGDLSKYVTNGIPEPEIKEIAENILRGLEVMHQHGYTHRDIKPQVGRIWTFGSR